VVNTTEQKPTSKTRKIQGIFFGSSCPDGSLFYSAIVLGKKTNFHAFLLAEMVSMFDFAVCRRPVQVASWNGSLAAARFLDLHCTA
jgi:hypothetical protein